jgi:peptidoglycan/LPS O-acetylase OafA/YrhL
MIEKLRYVDAMRGFAIAGVILVHTSLYDQDKYHILFRNLLDSGARGVQLFFLISAFTIFLSLDRRIQSERRVHRNFFTRRIYRIIPMYYLGILYYFWQNDYAVNLSLGTFWKVFANILFIHGTNPYWITSLVPGGWSLSVEMTFYALVPLLVKRVKSTEQALMFTIFSVLLADILNYIFYKHPLIVDWPMWKEFLFLYFPSQLPLFGLGIIAYFIIIKRDLTVNPSTILLLATLFIGQLMFGIVIFPHVLFGIGFLVIVIALSKREYPLIVNKLTCYLGKVSYSAYLVHFAVIHWLTQYSFMDYIHVENGLEAIINYWIRFSVVLAITVFQSAIFYRFIEQPFISLGKKLITKREHAIAIQ